MSSKTRLILVRHGETEANIQQVWFGSLDAPLTARGRLQIQATGQRFIEIHKRTPIDAIYVSPLARARATADAIVQAIGIEPIVDEGLREFSIGDWEGRSFRDLIEAEDLWGRWKVDPAFAPPNGESPASFSLRVLRDLQRLADRHAGQTVVVVTHGGVIGCVLNSWLGENTGEWVRQDPHNCSVSVLEWGGTHWQEVMVGDIAHLPPEAIVSEEPVYNDAAKQADPAD